MSYNLSKIFESEEFIETYTLYFKNFEKNIRRNEKFCQRNVDENRNSTIQQNNEIIIFFSRQL